MPTPLTTSRPIRKPDEAPPRKLTVRCTGFKVLRRNTLRGFAQVHIADLKLTIHDIAVHSRDGRSWAQLPAKPQIRDGQLVKDVGGKIQYFPAMTFDSREVADAFNTSSSTRCASTHLMPSRKGRGRHEVQPARLRSRLGRRRIWTR